jgi:hypothetical protein
MTYGSTLIKPDITPLGALSSPQKERGRRTYIMHISIGIIHVVSTLIKTDSNASRFGHLKPLPASIRYWYFRLIPSPPSTTGP